MFILVGFPGTPLLSLALAATDRPQTTISDLVQISPEDFQKPSAEAILDNINAKYANKVLRHRSSELLLSINSVLGNSEDWFMYLSI